MTIRKQLPLRAYDTFPSSTSSEAGQGSSETHPSTGSNKSRLSAAQEAQRLASQGSWADNVFRTPETTATPTASTVDEEDRREMGTDHNEYLSDPPPQYTPTDTTASTIPNSPVTTRAELVGGTQPSRRPPTPPMATSEGADEEQSMPGAYTPSSPILEQGEPTFFQHDSVKWKGGCKNNHTRRCKKAAWFTFALVACLWLMLPSLSVYHKVFITPSHVHSMTNVAPSLPPEVLTTLTLLTMTSGNLPFRLGQSQNASTDNTKHPRVFTAHSNYTIFSI
jgi:hypothetical protein